MPDSVISPRVEPGRYLLDLVAVPTRAVLARARVIALRGDLDGARRALHRASDGLPPDRSHDRVALGALEAEVLELDCRHDRALEAFEARVAPHLPHLAHDHRLAQLQNRAGIGAPSSDFYHLVDQRRALGLEWLDYHDLVVAEQKAAENRHPEALAILWQQLRRAYRSGCWAAQHWASGLFGKECVRLKEWDGAVHHALVSDARELLTGTATDLLSGRNAGALKAVVARVLETAHLRTHFVTACHMIKLLADAIPELQRPAVTEWLLARAAEVPAREYKRNVTLTAWETLAELGPHVPLEPARQIVRVATSHPAWTAQLGDTNRIIIERRAILSALVQIVGVLPVADLPALARAALPIALDSPQNPEYPQALHLLCLLAERSDAARDLIGPELYKPGRPVDRYLAQVAAVFGRGNTLGADQLARLGTQVVLDIGRQVQRLSASAEPVAPSEILMTAVHPNPDSNQKLVVYLAPLTGLRVLVGQRTRLPIDTIGELVRAVLLAARDRDNFLANRAELVGTLIEFADVATPALRAEIVTALDALARGPIEESAAYPTAADAANPLNPNKFHMGEPEDVRGTALVVLARYVEDGGTGARRFAELLEEAILDPNPAIRRAAFAAAARTRDVPEGVLLGVLSGLRDPDAPTAGTAFAALAARREWKLTRNHWRLFLLAARAGSGSVDPQLRRGVASALSAWQTACPPQFRPQLVELLNSLSADVCASVRRRAQVSPPSEAVATPEQSDS